MYNRFLLCLLACVILADDGRAEDWPRWRGPGGNAVSCETGLPKRWGKTTNVLWKTKIPGEGSSSPIVCSNRVFVTSALEEGLRRLVHCLDRRTGRILWTGEVPDDNPELTSALTGYAAATPVTDGGHVVAFFGNGGLVCYDVNGRLMWHQRLGEFESELGLASSPILFEDLVIQVCDHDGSRFRSFDSYLIAIELDTGAVRWKTQRPKLYRSWSTPIVVRTGRGSCELVVNAQDELRAYDPEDGELLWRVQGMTSWVTPSPVFGQGLIFATSGKDGPTMAVRPGGRDDVTQSHLVWQHQRGAPYVCSPLLYGDYLYVHNERGIVSCYDATTGKRRYQQRLPGKFTASGVAGDGMVMLTNEEGTTFVLEAGPSFRVISKNQLAEECLASPAISQGCLFIRTAEQLYCIGES